MSLLSIKIQTFKKDGRRFIRFESGSVMPASEIPVGWILKIDYADPSDEPTSDRQPLDGRGK